MVAEERGPLDRYDAGPLHLAVLSSRVCGPEEELIELQILEMESMYLDWKTETYCKRWHNQHLTWATELTSYKSNAKLKGCQVRSSTY
jgi:hypothetical protein